MLFELDRTLFGKSARPVTATLLFLSYMGIWLGGELNAVGEGRLRFQLSLLTLAGPLVLAFFEILVILPVFCSAWKTFDGLH